MRFSLLVLAAGQALAIELSSQLSAEKTMLEMCHKKCDRPHEHCRINKGSTGKPWSCACDQGYVMDAHRGCVVNQCFGKCPGVNMHCLVQKQLSLGYECMCEWGFKWDGVLRECVQDPVCKNKCTGKYEICEQQASSAGYRCQCYSGYYYDKAAKECKRHSKCEGKCLGDKMVCVVDDKHVDGHRCQCWSGYKWMDDTKTRCDSDPCFGKCTGPNHEGENCVEDISRPHGYRCQCSLSHQWLDDGRCKISCKTGHVVVGGKCYRKPEQCLAWKFQHHVARIRSVDAVKARADTKVATAGSSKWSSWSECSTSCGDGVRHRNSGKEVDYKRCFLAVCPFNLERQGMNPKDIHHVVQKRLLDECDRKCTRAHSHCRINNKGHREHYSCVCNEGYNMNDNNKCVEDKCYNKCTQAHSVCIQNSKLKSGYECQCMWGYQWKDDKTNTECIESPVCHGRCTGKAQVCEPENTKKGYRCKCWAGYEPTIDSSGNQTGDCERDERCKGKCTAGHMVCIPDDTAADRHRCQCWTGFRWKDDTHDTCIGDICTNKCKKNPNEKCVEDLGFISGFRCECQNGYYRVNSQSECVPNKCLTACSGAGETCVSDATKKSGFRCEICPKDKISIDGRCYNHPSLCAEWKV